MNSAGFFVMMLFYFISIIFAYNFGAEKMRRIQSAASKFEQKSKEKVRINTVVFKVISISHDDFSKVKEKDAINIFSDLHYVLKKEGNDLELIECSNYKRCYELSKTDIKTVSIIKKKINWEDVTGPIYLIKQIES